MTTLLVINDDPVQLHLLASLLEQDYEQVVRFTCSTSAWEWLQEGHVPDGIVLDLHMPGINGWRFCELLHTQVPRGHHVPPVLVVSATYSGIDAEVLVADIGASGFLPLPAEPAFIRQQVRLFLEKSEEPKGFYVWLVSSQTAEIERVRPALVERGWSVHEWNSGNHVKSETMRIAPDFIIVDHPMADMETKEFLIWCKQLYPYAMGLVIGVNDHNQGATAFSGWADRCLPMGCDPHILMTLCEKWRWERALTRVEHLLDVRTGDLKESEAQFRGLFEMLPDILVIYDEQGVIRHINASGAQQLGYVSDELIGTSIVGIQAPLLNDFGLSQDATEDRESRWSEALLRRKNGSDLPIEFMERGVRFQGKPQTLYVARDMTVRQHMAKENATLEQQLRQVQKMEAVGRLASGVAHDMNNILTAILAHSSLMKAQVDDSNPSWKAGDVIEKAVRRGKELTSQLLGFGRQGKYQHAPVDIHHVIQEVTGLLGRTMDKAIAMQVDLAAAEPWVVGDQNQLYQVLMNLAVNAADAMPQKGELIFCTSNELVSSEQAATIPGLVPGNYVVVRVTDTGEGMSQEVQAQVFEPFFTTKEKGQGSGMGLAMVYGIVKNHHGYIGVTSTLGLGTTMRVYLPLVMCEKPQPIVAPVAVVHSLGAGTVLIIDDEKEVAEAAQAILEYLGYDTIVRYSGKEAVDFLQDPTHHMDLVLLDMVMPDMSGPECFMEIRRLRPDSKIVLCTGYDRNHAVQELLNQGVVGFIQKPYDLDELSQVCKEALQNPVAVEACLSGIEA